MRLSYLVFVGFELEKMTEIGSLWGEMQVLWMRLRDLNVSSVLVLA